MWRAAALFYAAGAVVTLVALVLPHQPQVDEGGAAVLGAIAIAVCALLALGRERLPASTYPLLCFTGTLFVSFSLLFNGERHGGASGDDEMYYLWVVLYASCFLPPLMTAVQVALASGAYAVTLVVVAPGDVAVSRWVSTTGLLTGAAIVVCLLSARIARLIATLDAAAGSDPLTGLANRRAFEDAFERDLAHAERSGEGFALLVGDLDGFKELNDRFGHARGDEVLVTVGRLLRAQTRARDLAVRLGGDEFALLLADTGAPAAQAAGTRLAEACRREGGGIELSFGIAAHGPDGASLDELLRAADARLYVAKRDAQSASSSRRMPATGIATQSSRWLSS